MANPRHLRIVKRGTNAIARWREKNSKARLDLRSASLTDANLRGANLGHADLRDANLRGEDLREQTRSWRYPGGRQSTL